MTTPNIEDLRQVLFDTLAGLQDKENPLEIERALAIKEVSQVIVNTVKVEIDQRKLTNQIGTAFIPEKPINPDQPQIPGEVRNFTTQNGQKTVTVQANGVTVTRHKMGG